MRDKNGRSGLMFGFFGDFNGLSIVHIMYHLTSGFHVQDKNTDGGEFIDVFPCTSAPNSISFIDEQKYSQNHSQYTCTHSPLPWCPPRGGQSAAKLGSGITGTRNLEHSPRVCGGIVERHVLEGDSTSPSQTWTRLLQEAGFPNGVVADLPSDRLLHHFPPKGILPSVRFERLCRL